MRLIAIIALAFALLVTVPAAHAGKGKDKPPKKNAPHGLKLVTASSAVSNVQACGNPFDMGGDEYTLVCIMCPTLPDGPGGETVWVPMLWNVLIAKFDEGIYYLGYTYGCDTATWYYWT